MLRQRSQVPAAGLLPVAAVAVVLGALAQNSDDRALDLAAALLRTLVLGTAWLLLRQRARQPAGQRVMWVNVARAATVLVLCSAVDLVSVVLDRGTFAAQTTITALSLVCYLFVFQGLLHWNRVGTSVAAPGDWLNGICSLFVVAGLGNLLVSAVTDDRWNGWSWWQLQAWVLPVSGLVVVVATLLVVAWMSGFLDDWRVLVLSTGSAVMLIGSCLAGASGQVAPDGQSALLAAPLNAVLVAWCASAPPRNVTPRLASTLAPTVGSLLVGSTAIAVLIGSTRLETQDSLSPVVFAGIALLGVGWRLLSMVNDLTHLVVSRQQALTDDLTDLPNRRAFAGRLAAGSAGALMVLDLDRFKEVNDRHGHHTGDDLLREIGRRWAGILPPGASLARLSGDEFAVLVPGANAAAAQALAAAFTETLDHLEVGGGWRPAVSIGIAIGDGGGELLRRADAAMYLAKASGTGIGVYDDEVDRAVRARALLVEELLEVVSGEQLGRQFVVHYQPQLSTATGELFGVEALVRWHHPRLGVLKPEAFIDLVEDRGLMPFLTNHVLRVAVGQQQLWLERGLDVRMSVNLSASCLDHPELLPTLDEIAATSRLVVEVTETALMDDPASALAACHEIVRRGIGLSIDDYGTGYSSMSYLAVLPATELKIDRSFTAQIDEPRIRSIVAATVELAHSLGMRVVAEGIETADHLAAVRELGADETQGFLHSRALPALDLERWWSDRDDAQPTPGWTTSTRSRRTTMSQ